MIIRLRMRWRLLGLGVVGEVQSAIIKPDYPWVFAQEMKAGAGKTARLEAVDELVIHVGEAIVTVKKNGQLYASGSRLTLKASGDVLVVGRSN